MRTNRRNFLTLAGNTFLFSHFPSYAWSQINNNKILILIELQGANDGLNTVIPYKQKFYYNLRPTIGIEKSKILTIDKENGLLLGIAALELNFVSFNIVVALSTFTGVNNLHEVETSLKPPESKWDGYELSIFELKETISSSLSYEENHSFLIFISSKLMCESSII